MSVKKALNLADDARIGDTSSSEFSAEGGTPTFDRIPFRVLAGKNPSLNTFVVALRQNNDLVAHYGRVIEGSEMNIKARPTAMQQDDAYGMKRPDVRSSEQSPHLVRTMQIELLGELHYDNGKLKVVEPRSLPHTGQAVYEIPADAIPAMLNIPTDTDEGLHLGHIASGGRRVSFLLPNTAIARHIAILGKTGVGKTYAAGVLMEELYNKDIPILSFDVLGDMAQTAKELRGRHIMAGTQAFKIPYSILGLGEFLSFIPNITSDQRDLIGAAYGLVFDQALDLLDKGRPIHIPFSQLTGEIERIGRRINSRATDNAVRRTEVALDRSRLLTEKAVTWPNLLAKSPLTNIYVGHLDQNQRNLVVGAAARILQRLRRRKVIPPFVLVIDEAHLFLPGGVSPPPSTAVLRELVRTARHDEIGIVMLSQSPSSLDRQILLTCNTRMLFALDPEDLRVVAGQIGDLPEESINRIPRMARGTAVLTSGMDIMRHPVIVHIRERTITTHVADTPDMHEAVKKWRQKNQINP
jgi:DNA helicase HerA-like ATPase